MATVSQTPTFGDLHLGTPKIEPYPSETITIRMKTRKVDPTGTARTTGSTVSVARAWGILAIESGWAEYVSGEAPPDRLNRTVDEMRALVNSFTYDGSNRLTGFMADGIKHTLTYPDSTHIRYYIGANGREITLNASQLVTSITPL